MEAARAVFAEGSEVSTGAIPLMTRKAILREIPVVFGHQVVAVSLGKHGCGSNGIRDGVALYQGLLRERNTSQLECIDQEIICGRPERGDGDRHSSFCCLKDVYDVYLIRLDLTDGKGDRRFAEFACDLTPAFCGELFGIVQAGGNGPIGVEDACRRDNGAREAPTPNLINAGDQVISFAPGLILKIKADRPNSSIGLKFECFHGS